MDYLLFLYGLSFMGLAAVCLVARASGSRTMPWHWLLSFALSAALGEWLELVTTGLVENAHIVSIHGLCLLLSSLFLMEFGRAGVSVELVRRPSRWWVVLVGLAAAPAWIAAGPDDIEAAIRLGAGLVGGLWAALALVSVVRAQDGRKRRRLLLMALSLGSYAILIGLEGVLLSIFPAFMLHVNGFEPWLRELVQAAGIVLLLPTTVSLGAEACPPAAAPAIGSANRAPLLCSRWMLLAVLTVAGLGWGVTELAGRGGDAEARHEFLLRAQTMVSAINPEHVAALRRTPEDIGQPHYETLRQQLRTIRTCNLDCRFVYLMGLRGDKVVFLVDSEEEGSKDYSPPGQVYEKGSPELLSVFTTGKALVEGPITDPWGSWMSAHAPIRDPSSQEIVAIVGLDISAASWRQHVGMFRLAAIAVVFTISLLTLGFFITLEFSRRGKEALAQSEERYRTLFEKAQDGILLLDSQGACVDCNQAATELFRVSRQALEGSSIDQFFPKPLSKGPASPLKSEDRSGQMPSGRPLRFECLACRQGGESFDADVTINPIMVGSSQALLTQVRDISSQKERQKQIVQERERLAAVVDASPVASFMIDQNGVVLFWNRASEVMSHIPRELVLGKPLDLSPLLDGKPLPSLAELLLNGTEEELLNRYGKRGTIRFDSLLGVLECRSFFVVQGEKRNIRIVASRVHDTAGVLLGVIQCIQDVTDEDRLQRQLMHAEKMQSIGTLASGMAHEFNNILAAIRGYAQLVVMKLGSEHPTMRYLHEVDVSCQRAASLTQRMLAFSRADTGKQLPIKVNELLEGVCQLLRQTMPPEIEFDLDLQRGLPFVLADPNQMEQVIINLAVNARDAIPNGGTIRLRSRLLNSAEDLADSVSADPTAAGSGPYVEIQVEDNGTGMAAEVMERVFDPFFTTKEPGKGTGLGLYIVYSILKSHRGWVKPESAVGQGTRFRLFLPVLEDPAVKVPAPYPPEEREKLCGQGESVLVVEDEAPLRGLLQETLTAHGYGVTLAEDGVQAIQQCQRAIDGRAPFDVVVLDLAMPVMRGEDCLHHLLDLDPCLRVLLISGLPDEIPQATLHRHALLRKPFQLQAFLGELRTVLVQD